MTGVMPCSWIHLGQTLIWVGLGEGWGWGKGDPPDWLSPTPQACRAVLLLTHFHNSASRAALLVSVTVVVCLFICLCYC